MCLTTLNADSPSEGIQLSWYACAQPGGYAQVRKHSQKYTKSPKSTHRMAMMQKFKASYAGNKRYQRVVTLAVVQNKLRHHHRN